MRVVRLLLVTALAVVTAAPMARAGLLVNVYAGYLNNLSGPPSPGDIPTPFDSSATTTLISSGGVTTDHDTGVIRFENAGTISVTIDPGLMVTTQGATFQIWDGSLPFVLAPGQNLVLAETANFNFDSSDFGLAINPVVSGSVSGNGFSFTDTARILLGHEEAGNTAETTPYGLLGTLSAVPEPSTLLGGGIACIFGLACARLRRGQARLAA